MSSLIDLINHAYGQDGVVGIGAVAANPKGRDLAWQFVQEKYV